MKVSPRQDASEINAASGCKSIETHVRTQRNERVRQEARGNSVSIRLAQFMSGAFIASKCSGLASELKGPASGC